VFTECVIDFCVLSFLNFVYNFNLTSFCNAEYLENDIGWPLGDDCMRGLTWLSSAAWVFLRSASRSYAEL